MLLERNRWRPDETRRNFAEAFENQNGITVVFCDTETTGLDPEQNDIIQYSGIKYRWQDRQLIEIGVLDMYINPGYEIPAEITKITGITNETVSTAPDQTTAFNMIDEFMSDMDVFVAYNTPFDQGMLEGFYRKMGAEFTPAQTFDVMAMAIDLINMYKLRSKTLKSVSVYLKVAKKDDGFHDSLVDIRTTANVFLSLFDEYAKLPIPESYGRKRIPKIYRAWYWENPQRNLMKRIYFNTDCGQIFYEMNDRSFGLGKDPQYQFDELDLNAFILNATRYFGVERLEDLTHLKREQIEASQQVASFF